MKLTKPHPMRFTERMYSRVTELARVADRTFADQLRWLVEKGLGRICRRCGGSGIEPPGDK